MRLKLVDEFKGIAIILIVFVHYSQSFDMDNLMGEISKFGQMGCQIFFLMSSFTLAHSYSKSNQILEFYIRRFKRIVPGYWTIIIVNFLLMVASVTMFTNNYFLTSTNFIDYVVNLFLLNGLTPGLANNHVVLGGWYIGTLIIFYVLYPILYKIYFCLCLSRRYWSFPAIVLLLSCIIINILKCIFGAECTNNSFLYFSFINQLPGFVLGFTLYDIVENHIEVKCILGKFLFFLILSIFLFFHPVDYSSTISPFLFTVAVVFLYLYCNKRQMTNGLIVKLLENFSNLSYSIYLTHIFVVLYLVKVIIKLIDVDSFVSIIYLLMLAPAYYLVYLVGKYFNIYIEKIDAILSKIK